MTLDINTPKGQETLKEEARLVELLKERFPDVEYKSTDRTDRAPIDTVLCRGDDVVAVAEAKCRRMRVSDLFDKYHGNWLITFDKVLKLREAALLLRVPAVGLLYCVDDDELIVVRLFDKDGEAIGSMRVERTQTQATVNGGVAFRTNAFVRVPR